MSAARTAGRCFAVARSTTFATERAAAIARGIAIAEKAGLDLDSFDIPGRSPRASDPRKQSFDQIYENGRTRDEDASFDWTAYQDELQRWAAASGPTARKVRGGEAPRRYSSADVAELTRGMRRHASGVTGSLEDLYDTLERRSAEVGARPEETVYSARRRNFDEASKRPIDDPEAGR